MDEAKAKDRHDACVHAEACDRAFDMRSMWYQKRIDWLRCDRCDAYDSQHCPMAYSGTMRCRGLA